VYHIVILTIFYIANAAGILIKRLLADFVNDLTKRQPSCKKDFTTKGKLLILLGSNGKGHDPQKYQKMLISCIETTGQRAPVDTGAGKG
jgi:hypothetical protein